MSVRYCMLMSAHTSTVSKVTFIGFCWLSCCQTCCWQFTFVTRWPYCPRGPKKLCFTTLSLIPMVSIARLSVVKQSSFGLPGQYGRRVTRVNTWDFSFQRSLTWKGVSASPIIYTFYWAEFKGCTLSYRSLFPLSTSHSDHKLKRKNQGAITYSRDWEDNFIISKMSI